MWLRFGTQPEACVVLAEARIVVKTSTGAILSLQKNERAILILPDQSEFPDALATYDQLAAIRGPICTE
jgi:UDP-N-acetylglucosamine transferase subunit ALG13